jgi:hypothetical protein
MASIQKGADDGNVSDQEALRSFSTAPFNAVANFFQGQNQDATEMGYLGWLTQRDVADWELSAQKLLLHVPGPEALECARDKLVCQWRRVVGRSMLHWIVPVWFGMFVLRLDRSKLIMRLRPDLADLKIVLNLYGRFDDVRVARRSSGVQSTIPGRAIGRRTTP